MSKSTPEQNKSWYSRNRQDIRKKRNSAYAADPEARQRALQRDRERYRKNPRIKYDGHLRRKYGLTRDKYDEMLKLQNGKCALCFEVMANPFVDHDHKTRKVRELLCSNCNTVIGMAREDTNLLKRVISYLVKHSL